MYKQRESGRSLSKEKLYTQQQVIRLYQKQLQPKLSNLHKQMEQKQHTIRQLNEIINQNDIRINHQSKLIQSLKQKINSRSCSINNYNQTENYQKQINEKFEAFSKQLGVILNNIKQVTNRKTQRLAIEAANAFKDLQNIVSNAIQNYKNRSNKYWQNIKTSLSKIHDKIIANQQKVAILQNSFSTFSRSYMMSGQIQKCKNFLLKFSDIKNSISNIQQHYKQLLTLQRNKSKKDSVSLIDLQYSREQSQQKNNSYYKVKNEIFSNETKVPTRQSEKEYVENKQKNNSNKKFSQSSMLSLTPSNLMHTTALINLSMQTRRSMIQSCRERLLQLIQLKKLQKPISCYLDQINYLKNSQNNYIFDIKGNMFKMSKQNYKTLQKEGIVKQCYVDVPVSHIS